jgi:hypothetical protein
MPGQPHDDAARRYLAHARNVFTERAAGAPDMAACAQACLAAEAAGDLPGALAHLTDLGDRFPMPRAYWLALRQGAMTLRLEPEVNAIDRRLRAG